MDEHEKNGEKPTGWFIGEARKRHDTKTRTLDRAAVKLEIHVHCAVGEETFAPPLTVSVNNTLQHVRINEKPDSPRNRCTLWCEVPITRSGPKKLGIALEPDDQAQKYFHKAKTKKKIYQHVISRNTSEFNGEKFQVPPVEDTYPAHILHIALRPKPKGLLFSFAPKDLPEAWRADAPAAEEDAEDES